MRAARQTLYALRVLVAILDRGGDRRVNAETLSGEAGTPLSYTRKILRRLKRAQIVNSTKGSGGGCTLAHDPANVNLLDVVEAMEGPVVVSPCVADASVCPRSEHCRARRAWARAAAAMRRALAAITLEDAAWR